MADQGQLTIRDATPDDAPAIAAVHVGAWQVAYRGQIPDEVLDGLRLETRERWWRIDWWKRAGGSHRLLIAQSEADIVGFAAAGPSRDDDVREAIGRPELLGLACALGRPARHGVERAQGGGSRNGPCTNCAHPDDL